MGKQNKNKKQICQFKLKFDTWTNLNMKNSMVMLFFSCLGQKYLFLEKFFQKIKIVCWSWNLELTLIWIWRIGLWFCLFVCLFLFFFLDWKQLFKVNLVQKIKTVSWSWNWICIIWWWCSYFCFRLFRFSILMLTD